VRALKWLVAMCGEATYICSLLSVTRYGLDNHKTQTQRNNTKCCHMWVICKYVRDQVFTLLRCYIVYVGSCLLGQPISSILKGPTVCPGTSANICQQSLHNTPEEWRPHLRRGKTLNLTPIKITSSFFPCGAATRRGSWPPPFTRFSRSHTTTQHSR